LKPVVFIETPKGMCPPFSFDPGTLEAPGGKAQLEASIRDRVVEQKATLVIVVAEAWAAAIPAVEANIAQLGGDILRASARENRQEVVSVNIQTPDSTVSGTTLIIRGADGKPDVSAEPPVLHPTQGSIRFFCT
jgi:hypothetical protein